MDRKLKDHMIISVLATTMSSAAALIPVLSSIAKAFPEYAHLIHLLVTIPPLMIMIASMTVSPLLKFLPSKKITILGLILILFSGVYPYFSHSFILLLISRVIMGFGLGLITTISSSLPARYFPSGKDRDTATGLQSAFSSLGGVLFSFLSGFVANYYWKGVFLVQLLNLIPLIFIFLYMKPHFDQNIDPILDPLLEPLEPLGHLYVPDNKPENKSGKIFVKDAFLITLLAFIYVVISATFPLNLSLYVDQKGLGTTNLTGSIASINAFIGFLIGIMFYKINRGLKTYTLSASLFIVSLSFFIVSRTLSPLTFLIGSTLFGIGTSLVYPAFLTSIYNKIPDEDIVPAIGMYTVAANIAQFVSPFIINTISSGFGSQIEHKFIFSAIATTILGILIIIVKKTNISSSTN
ncbi:MAG TPA: MFS transporter [Epulopiscium sp.]|nr:MFS transporter [Candidatus Epulonipiscium sp.]